MIAVNSIFDSSIFGGEGPTMSFWTFLGNLVGYDRVSSFSLFDRFGLIDRFRLLDRFRLVGRLGRRGILTSALVAASSLTASAAFRVDAVGPAKVGIATAARVGSGIKGIGLWLDAASAFAIIFRVDREGALEKMW